MTEIANSITIYRFGISSFTEEEIQFLENKIIEINSIIEKTLNIDTLELSGNIIDKIIINKIPKVLIIHEQNIWCFESEILDNIKSITNVILSWIFSFRLKYILNDIKLFSNSYPNNTNTSTLDENINKILNNLHSKSQLSNTDLNEIPVSLCLPKVFCSNHDFVNSNNMLSEVNYQAITTYFKEYNKIISQSCNTSITSSIDAEIIKAKAILTSLKASEIYSVLNNDIKKIDEENHLKKTYIISQNNSYNEIAIKDNIEDNSSIYIDEIFNDLNYNIKNLELDMFIHSSSSLNNAFVGLTEVIGKSTIVSAIIEAISLGKKIHLSMIKNSALSLALFYNAIIKIPDVIKLTSNNSTPNDDSSIASIDDNEIYTDETSIKDKSLENIYSNLEHDGDLAKCLGSTLCEEIIFFYFTSPTKAKFFINDLELQGADLYDFFSNTMNTSYSRISIQTNDYRILKDINSSNLYIFNDSIILSFSKSINFYLREAQSTIIIKAKTNEIQIFSKFGNLFLLRESQNHPWKYSDTKTIIKSVCSYFGLVTYYNSYFGLILRIGDFEILIQSQGIFMAASSTSLKYQESDFIISSNPLVTWIGQYSQNISDFEKNMELIRPLILNNIRTDFNKLRYFIPFDRNTTDITRNIKNNNIKDDTFLNMFHLDCKAIIGVPTIQKNSLQSSSTALTCISPRKLVKSRYKNTQQIEYKNDLNIKNKLDKLFICKKEYSEVISSPISIPPIYSINIIGNLLKLFLFPVYINNVITCPTCYFNIASVIANTNYQTKENNSNKNTSLLKTQVKNQILVKDKTILSSRSLFENKYINITLSNKKKKIQNGPICYRSGSLPLVKKYRRYFNFCRHHERNSEYINSTQDIFKMLNLKTIIFNGIDSNSYNKESFLSKFYKAKSNTKKKNGLKEYIDTKFYSTNHDVSHNKLQNSFQTSEIFNYNKSQDDNSFFNHSNNIKNFDIPFSKDISGNNSTMYKDTENILESNINFVNKNLTNLSIFNLLPTKFVLSNLTTKLSNISLDESRIIEEIRILFKKASQYFLANCDANVIKNIIDQIYKIILEKPRLYSRFYQYQKILDNAIETFEISDHISYNTEDIYKSSFSDFNFITKYLHEACSNTYIYKSIITQNEEPILNIKDFLSNKQIYLWINSITNINLSVDIQSAEKQFYKKINDIDSTNHNLKPENYINFPDNQISCLTYNSKFNGCYISDNNQIESKYNDSNNLEKYNHSQKSSLKINDINLDGNDGINISVIPQNADLTIPNLRESTKYNLDWRISSTITSFYISILKLWLKKKNWKPIIKEDLKKTYENIWHQINLTLPFELIKVNHQVYKIHPCPPLSSYLKDKPGPCIPIPPELIKIDSLTNYQEINEEYTGTIQQSPCSIMFKTNRYNKGTLPLTQSQRYKKTLLPPVGSANDFDKNFTSLNPDSSIFHKTAIKSSKNTKIITETYNSEDKKQYNFSIYPKSLILKPGEWESIRVKNIANRPERFSAYSNFLHISYSRGPVISGLERIVRIGLPPSADVGCIYILNIRDQVGTQEFVIEARN